MKFPLRAFTVTLGLLTFASGVHAHPGHDGHELTWDLGHLAAHPWATLGCLTVFAAAGWLGWQLLRRSGLFRR